MENLKDIIFYNLDKAIRSYRQYAHQQLNDNGFDITVDQWLVLKSVKENPDFSQHQLAGMIFKDFASLTRMIELLVKKKYLERSVHAGDRRRFNLSLTPQAQLLLEKMQPVIDNNRKHALTGVSQSAIDELQKSLEQIIKNCSEKLNTK